MNRAQEKAIRLLQIEELLWAHPEGLTQSQIAERLGVNRSTIWKYIDKDHLPPSIYVDDIGDNRLKLDRNADLTKASFSLHEVMAIHLATRLLATRTDKQNPHAASALRKLGIALQRLDRNVSQHLLRSADVMDEEASYRDPVYLRALETLTEAWSAGRKVKVQHQMENGRVFEYAFSPYFIEPYAVGQTAHVIGLREPPGAVRTFKIERLRSVQVTADRYEIPDDFDPKGLLRDAWGIWYSENEPVEVVLRFHPRVATRQGKPLAPQPTGGAAAQRPPSLARLRRRAAGDAAVDLRVGSGLRSAGAGGVARPSRCRHPSPGQSLRMGNTSPVDRSARVW